MSILADSGTIVPALFRQAMGDKDGVLRAGMWVLFGSDVDWRLGRLFIYKRSRLWRGIWNAAFVLHVSGMAWIIFWGVIDRFVFSNQVPWSTTIPPFLFMIMAWFGCSYNVKLRTHLSFSEFRMKMTRARQWTR